MTVHRLVEQGYKLGATLYETARPSYPLEALKKIQQLLNPHSQPSYLDLAAGTGKLTRCLLPLVSPTSQFIAVEPVAEMRRVFCKTVPHCHVLKGTAQDIPLPSHSIDAVFIGQAFHWFATPPTLKELARVLKPQGQLFLVWNMEDQDRMEPDYAWVAKIRQEYEKYENNTPQYRLGLWKSIWKTRLAQELFAPLDSESWRYTVSVPKQTIWDRVASKSYISCLSKEQQQEVRTSVMRHIQHLPNDTFIEYPYQTDLFWTRVIKEHE